MGSQILALQCDSEFLPVAYSVMHATINPYVIVLTCSMCLLMMGSECVWAFGEGSNSQLVRGPQN